jgi:hypothetical protein
MVGLNGKLVRVGDLCKHSLGYDNGRSVDVWCKLVSIKDEKGNLHSEYNIITGYGDKNSKVTLDLKPLLYCKDLSNYDLAYGNLVNIIKDINPHNVYFHYDYWLKETEEKIEFLLKKKEFLLKNKNIIDKINSIL